jgi:hypothetical protein
METWSRSLTVLKNVISVIGILLSSLCNQRFSFVYEYYNRHCNNAMCISAAKIILAHTAIAEASLFIQRM